jgi:hypothetical protein
MSRLYGSLSGSASTAATRCGSKSSGISAHVRGWDVGVQVDGYVNCEVDTFGIYATGGSNGSSPRQFLGTVSLVNGSPVFTPAGSEA